MIDRAALLRLTIVAAVVCALAAGTAFVAWGARVSGGVAVGGVLGMIPFLSWTYIAGSIEANPRRKALAALLLIGKIGVYAAALYLTVTRQVVSGVGVMAGIGLVSFLFLTGAMMLPRPREARP